MHRQPRGGKKARLVIAAGAVLSSLALVPATSAAHLSCGAVVTTDTVLQNNLVGCPDTGITIVADGNVRLDLNGHRITGTGNAAGVAAEVAPGASATVANGVVTGFGVGITASTSGFPFTGKATVRNVRAVLNGTGFRFSEIGAVVSDSEAVWSSGDGIATGPPASPVRLVRNRVAHNGGDGIATPFSEPAVIADNHVTDNGGIGIFTTDATTSLVGNTASRNGSHGIFVTDDTMIFFPYLFRGNTAVANGGYGIAFISSAPTGPNGETVDGGGNSAKYNRGPAQCVNIVCTRRPAGG